MLFYSTKSLHWRPSWPLHRLYPLAGVALALATLVGLLAFRILRSELPWSKGWLIAELSSQGATYMYLAISTIVLFVMLGLVLGRKEERLWATALTDPGTGLPNRRHFEQRLSLEIGYACHCGTPLGLLMVDVDRLKALNDGSGHQTGDSALRLVAQSLRLTCRSRDLAARWGGDEFVVLLPGTTAEQACAMAERVRSGLRRLAAGRPGLAHLTVSIGASDLERVRPRTGTALFASADRALYFAKEHGRNCVFVARPVAARNGGHVVSSAGSHRKEHADVLP
jgi:diguanylate cyclase (GGDEF)-like protein